MARKASLEARGGDLRDGREDGRASPENHSGGATGGSWRTLAALFPNAPFFTAQDGARGRAEAFGAAAGLRGSPEDGNRAGILVSSRSLPMNVAVQSAPEDYDRQEDEPSRFGSPIYSLRRPRNNDPWSGSVLAFN